MKTRNNEFSFWKGWSQVKLKDHVKVKERIMEALNIKTRLAWCQRRSGKVEPRISEAKAIESIFAEYGIKDVWGKRDE